MPVRWQEVVIVLVISAFHQVNFASSNFCVMRGICGDGNFGPEFCFHNGTPSILQFNEDYGILSRVCPEVTEHESDRVCCSVEQLQSLEIQFELAAEMGLGICPSCTANLKKLFCMLICSPRQSDFLKEEIVHANYDGYLVVDKVTYFISRSFAEGLFSSCKDIKGLANGITFLDMVCGDSYEGKCNEELMLQHMGSTPENGGYSNIEIVFEIVPEGAFAHSNQGPIQIFHPMDEETFSCSEIPFPGAPVCSCEDCEASCKTTTESWTSDDIEYHTMTEWDWYEDEDSTQTTMNDLTTVESTTSRGPLKPLTTKVQISNAKQTSYSYQIHFSSLILLLYYFVL